VDGFLHYLPKEQFVTLRLPPAGAAKDSPGKEALLAALDREDALPDHEGLARDVGAGLVLTPSGAWARFWPAQDKGVLNEALRAEASKLVFREEGTWTILASSPLAMGKRAGAPLPPGDIALRVRFHPLLDAVFQPGDTLELGLTLGGAGIDMKGRLRYGEKSATRERVAAAPVCAGGLIDFIPSGLGIRAETTLPATFLADFFTRRVAAHCTIRDPQDRVRLERLLREATTGADPATGIALGIEFRDAKASFVVLGRIADGPPSPILARIGKHARTSFGVVVLDTLPLARRDLLAYRAWIVDAEPKLENLPETAWRLLAGLSGGENAGVPIVYAEQDGYFMAAAGPRADILVSSVRRRIRTGTTRSIGSTELRGARERGKGDYVLGVILAGTGFAELAESDRAVLRATLGAGPGATPPSSISVAALRDGDELELVGRALY